MTAEARNDAPVRPLLVVGLGKLGAPLAAVLAEAGHDVIGHDVTAAAVDAINAGRAPVEEPELPELIAANRARLRAVSDVSLAVQETEASFIIVPTPSGPDGTFTNEYVLRAVRDIGAALRGTSHYHVVVITSTVMPGSTDGPIRRAIEEASGKKVGLELGLCYSPEFIALGSVVRDLRRPDMILIGESDPKAGDLVESVYRRVCGDVPTIRRMSSMNAEIVKIAINTFVTTKIAYANMLADLCERVPGADVETVTQAVGTDRRIGARYLRGGLAYGGPCFPRDNRALGIFCNSLGVRAEIPAATETMNRQQTSRIVRLVGEYIGRGKRIGIAGLSYKAGTAVIEESPGIAIAHALTEAGYPVVVWDPLARPPSALAQAVQVAASLEEVARAVDLLVVATDAPECRNLPLAAVSGRSPRLIVLDCWRAVDRARYSGAVEIVYLGVSPTRLALRDQ